MIMQFFWKYVDDLIGKGLELSVIGELVFYLSATMVPLTLPIAVLLSSIMTFGKMGEHYELVALKSAGISLTRFMLPLGVFALFISGVSFTFTNWVTPRAQLKSSTLLYSITRQRPALNIKPGVYYKDIDGYVIRIGSKAKDNSTIYDIKIYNHTSQRGNVDMIVAEQGEMFTVGKDSSLIFRLQNGIQYQELPQKGANKSQYEYMRTHFEEYEMMFDLSAFKFQESDERIFESNQRMLSVGQLKQVIDSLDVDGIDLVHRMTRSLRSHYSFMRDTFQFDQKLDYSSKLTTGSDYLASFNAPPSAQKEVVERAKNQARNVKSFSRVNKQRLKNDEKKINRFAIEFHYKIAISLACFVLFMIGAPLGAIIRKGGFGLPMVIAIFFFAIFHILSTVGKKAAEKFVFSAFTGAWMATIILLPLGILLTYWVNSDHPIAKKIIASRGGLNYIIAFFNQFSRKKTDV